jgi:hypothetical protein
VNSSIRKLYYISIRPFDGTFLKSAMDEPNLSDVFEMLITRMIVLLTALQSATHKAKIDIM